MQAELGEGSKEKREKENHDYTREYREEAKEVQNPGRQEEKRIHMREISQPSNTTVSLRS